MRKLFFLALIALGAFAAAPAQAQGGTVLVGTIEGVINPITAQYVDRVVSEAERRDLAAVVFRINTPGGLTDSTFQITTRFLNAKVPVITYVAPSGARAASAGTFITMAGHVAAMAPATNIGAAHPVDSSGNDIQGDMRTKVENDTVAAAQKIALARGRNAQWAEDAVRKSSSIRDDEAAKLDVVDFVATDVDDVLRKASGLSVDVAGVKRTLSLEGAALEDDGPNAIESFLHIVVDPQIALLLFSLGTYGIIFELANPGLIFPGIIGVVAIVLALFSFGTLDANSAGVALLVFSVILFVADVKMASHGFLTAGGIASLVLGAILLFPPWNPTLPGMQLAIHPAVIGGITAVTGGFFLLMLRGAWQSRHLPVVTGSEALRGAVGYAVSDLAPDGVVRVGGEPWSATSAAGAIPKGSAVRVRAVDSVRLIVEPVAPDARAR